MKVDIGENDGGASITCYCGEYEVKFEHKERKRDDENKPIDEFDVMTALLNAAVAGVGAMPRPELPPEGGETTSQRKEREKRYTEALDEYYAEQDRKAQEELEAAEQQMIEDRANQPEPQPEQPAEQQPQQGEPQPA